MQLFHENEDGIGEQSPENPISDACGKFVKAGGMKAPRMAQPYRFVIDLNNGFRDK